MGTCSGSLGRYHRRPGRQRARVTGRTGWVATSGTRGREEGALRSEAEPPGAQGPKAPAARRVGCWREREEPARCPAPAPPPPSRPGSTQPRSCGPLGPRPGRAAGRVSPGESSSETAGLAARTEGAGTPAGTGERQEGGTGREAGVAEPRGREAGQSSERTRGCGERDSEPKEGGLLGGKERCSPLLTNLRKGKGRRSGVPGPTWRDTSTCLGGLSSPSPVHPESGEASTEVEGEGMEPPACLPASPRGSQRLAKPDRACSLSAHL